MKLGIYSETTVQIERLCQEHIISTRQYYEIPEEHRSEFVNMVMSDMAHDYVRTLWNRGLIKFATQMTDRGLRINSYMGVVNPPID